jgi:hypothetical protein
LADVVCTDNASVGFKDSNYVLLVGAKPRGPGKDFFYIFIEVQVSNQAWREPIY